MLILLEKKCRRSLQYNTKATAISDSLKKTCSQFQTPFKALCATPGFETLLLKFGSCKFCIHIITMQIFKGWHGNSTVAPRVLVMECIDDNLYDILNECTVLLKNNCIIFCKHSAAPLANHGSLDSEILI